MWSVDSMATHQPEASSMDQVRDLLMGTQLKDMETRFHRQEERFLREIAELREHVKTRAESLEKFMKSETASLLHRLQEEQTERAAALKNEQKERQDGIRTEQRERAEALKANKDERDQALAQLTTNLANQGDTLERRLTALSGTLDKVEQELRQLFLSENMRLTETVEEKYRDALNRLASTAAELRHDLVARSALSGLFTETAVKLSGEWPVNGPLPPAPGKPAAAPAPTPAAKGANVESQES